MCKPNNSLNDTDSVKNVVVVGAGPAGLLTAILHLRRNLTATTPKYRVTLVDPGTDYGALDKDGLNRARSLMIGLSAHGLTAIKSVPDLYEKYLEGLGIHTTHARIGLSKSIKFDLDVKDILPKDVSAFTVDRNYICAALSRYLKDHFAPNERGSNCVTRYYTRALYVDGANQQVLVRCSEPNNNKDDKVGYDILVGADGIRSVVRNAFLTHHRDFEFDVKSTFSYGKSVHVNVPPGLEPGTFMLLVDALPNMVSFVLPETGGKLNVNVGIKQDLECPQALQSDDPQVVADYFLEHWHAFDIDAEETGKQWVEQGWNTTSQVHCRPYYHSMELQALIIGDAAHATSPAIGQGMNTALADAKVLNDLLDKHKDDWTAVLPQFSALRVKEGNALTDLSFHTYSLSPMQQLELMFRQHFRRTLNRFAPWLFDPDCHGLGFE